jgi:hypothetical protein
MTKQFKSQFDTVARFRDGYAVVTKGDLQGVADALGAVVIPLQDPSAHGAVHGPIRFGDKRTQPKQVLFEHECGTDHRDYDPCAKFGLTLLPEGSATGLAFDDVHLPDASLGCIRVQQAKRTEKDDMGRYQRHGGWGLLGNRLEQVLLCEYDAIRMEYEVNAASVQKGDRWGVVCIPAGEWLAPCNYDAVFLLSDAMYLVSGDTTLRRGFGTEIRETLIPHRIVAVESDSSLIQSGELFGRCDANGQLLVACKFASPEEVPLQVLSLPRMKTNEQPFVATQWFSLFTQWCAEIPAGFQLPYESQSGLSSGEVLIVPTYLTSESGEARALLVRSIYGVKLHVIVLLEAADGWPDGAVFAVNRDRLQQIAHNDATAINKLEHCLLLAQEPF